TDILYYLVHEQMIGRQFTKAIVDVVDNLSSCSSLCIRADPFGIEVAPMSHLFISRTGLEFGDVDIEQWMADGADDTVDILEYRTDFCSPAIGIDPVRPSFSQRLLNLPWQVVEAGEECFVRLLDILCVGTANGSEAPALNQ